MTRSLARAALLVMLGSAVPALFGAPLASARAAAAPSNPAVAAAAEPRTTLRLVPRSDRASTPRLANERDVVGAVLLPMTDSGIVADGTVFASVRLGADGRVVLLGNFYGAVYTANTELQRWLIDATARARFDVPPEWRTANPDGHWAVFWIFQTNGCRPATFDAPANTTTIRVCIAVVDGQVRSASSSYLVDTDVIEGPRVPQPVFTAKRVPQYIGWSLVLAGVVGEVTLRVTLDERGRVVARETLASTPGKPYEYWLAGWQRVARYELPPDWPAPGEPRTVELRIAFDVAPPGATECRWVLPMYAGDDHRVCAGIYD